MKYFIKNLIQNGFTLVELMVVVAIIGLLSAVAVPNFKKYQAKAKIAEAKLHLSAIYTAEASFFSEYNMYGHCLRFMGYDPDTERASRYYATGFFELENRIYDLTAYASALNSGLNSQGCPPNQDVLDGTNNIDLAATTFSAGKGVGANTAHSATGVYNDAGLNLSPCTKTVINVSTGGGCVGAQGVNEDIVYQASAVGVISATANYEEYSGLTINNDKIIKIVVPGY